MITSTLNEISKYSHDIPGVLSEVIDLNVIKAWSYFHMVLLFLFSSEDDQILFESVNSFLFIKIRRMSSLHVRGVAVAPFLLHHSSRFVFSPFPS